MTESLDRKRVGEIVSHITSKPDVAARIFMEEGIVSLEERLNITCSDRSDLLYKVAGPEYANIRLGMAVPIITLLKDVLMARQDEVLGWFKTIVIDRMAPWMAVSPKAYYRYEWYRRNFSKVMDTLSKAGIIRIVGDKVMLEVDDNIEIVSRFYGSISDNAFKRISFERGLALSTIHDAGPSGIEADFVPVRIKTFCGYEIKNWDKKRYSILQVHGPEGTGYIVTFFNRLIRSPNKVGRKWGDRLPSVHEEAYKLLIELGVLPDELIVTLFGPEALQEMLKVSRWAENSDVRCIVRVGTIFIDGYRVKLLNLLEPDIEIETVTPIVTEMYWRVMSVDEAIKVKNSAKNITKDIVRTGKAEPSKPEERMVCEVLRRYGILTRKGAVYELNPSMMGVVKCIRRLLE